MMDEIQLKAERYMYISRRNAEGHSELNKKSNQEKAGLVARKSLKEGSTDTESQKVS